MSNIGQQTSASRGGSFNPLGDPIHAKVQKAFNRLTKAKWYDSEGKTRLGVGFASMLSRLPFVEDNSQSTMCTNGSCIKFNRKFVDKCSLDEVIFVLVHESDHVAYCHHLRLGKRDHKLANIAMDFAINIHLDECGFVPPDGVLIDETFRGWTWEKIYSFLYKKWEEELNDDPDGDDEGEGSGDEDSDEDGEGSGDEDSDEEGQGNGEGDEESDEDGQGSGESDEDSDGEGEGQGSGDGDPVQGEVGWEDIDPTNLPDSVGNVEEATDEDGKKASDWDDSKIQEEAGKIGTAVSQARSVEKLAGRGIGSGDDYQSSTGDLLGSNEIPVTWIEQVAQFLEVSKSQDYDFARPNRRFVGNDEYFPSMDSPEGGHLALAIDTSGSVSFGEMQSFVGSINTLVERFSFEKVTIIYCNHRITAVRTFEDGDEVEVEVQTSGGTTFYPPFELIERGGNDKFGDIDRPTVAIYFTDGYGDVRHHNPAQSYCGCDEDGNVLEPDYPVLWATTQIDPADMGVPWGQTVWVDLHE